MIDNRDIPCNQTNINPGIWVVQYNYRLTKVADDQGRNPTTVDDRASKEVGAFDMRARA